MLKRPIKTILATSLFVSITQAGELQTDWITPVSGQKEGKLGASVTAVETNEAGEATKVTLAIPKPVIKDTDDVEEIVVVGKRPDETEEPIKIRHEWVSDYDKDNYGLVIYLGKHGNTPLRLYLSSPD